ncbi:MULTISPECIES: RibD family protein [unclassified Mesorhizobium]|uniref:RibD family protein n=1 Tax=unclassified Mesorhizobium TaxID=325217 RepID=UPI000FD9D079|nr:MULTISPECIES: RibD family protein [unclassified Mesorhizobium]TGR47323.1 RibD family protein [bacterium M00.F.Ca.ET.199.01.1.1]TGU36777.1 RibD family protein [bacterium M00.F.Ca.ET.156.01.1.1]TGV87965.1 RibD family protein [Mesorhizobium sp. M00.F.Ca.ET.149.01.1.1]TGR29037.1 RibD family protein [Mesorhizobium sp. M8A.F.Ca.ET.202.01.1.1]TGR29737.1 RibD family protein [Mesorhizobium sp. M8A.F.Ca.ET.197.01.1.1]
MKPHIICHMLASLDGGLHPSRYTESPDGSRAEWSGLYEQIHNDLEGDAWIVGRVTMAEMSKAGAHPPAHAGKVERPHHFARRDAGSYALALDASGKLHFAKPDIGGDHVVVLLGRDVEDSHLAELAADGVSYIVSETADIDLAAMLDVLGRELGIRRLLLEGGAGINGSFFAAGLVDELSLLVAPALDARAANQGVVEFGEAGLAGKMRLSLKSCQTLAHGLVQLRYAVSPG